MPHCGPWAVEPKFRTFAFVIFFVVVGNLIVYLISGSYRIFSEPPTVDIAQDIKWGNLPDLRICAFEGTEASFAFFDLVVDKQWMKQKEAGVDLSTVKHEVLHHAGGLSDCLLIKTSVVKPHFLPYEHFQLDFAISAVLTYNFSVPATLAGVSSTLIMHATGTHGHQVGTLASLEPWRQDAQAYGWYEDVHLYKERVVHLNGTQVDHFTASQKSYRLISHNRAPPQNPVMSANGKNNNGSLLPNATDLSLIRFGLYIASAHGSVPTLTSFKYVPRRDRFFWHVGSVGGILTLVFRLYHVIFPRRYPMSTVAVTYDSRTLIGHTSRESRDWALEMGRIATTRST